MLNTKYNEVNDLSRVISGIDNLDKDFEDVFPISNQHAAEHRVSNVNLLGQHTLQKPHLDIHDHITPRALHQNTPRENIDGHEELDEFLLQYPIGLLKVKIDDNKFIFHDYDDVFIGQFSINDLINYVAKLPNIEPATRKLIELTICKYATNNMTIGYDIKLNKSSPFMSDIEILMKLNKLLKHFEANEIYNLNDFASHEAILKNIRIFIYSIVEHTLDVISIVSKQLKSGSNDVLKNKLMRYSVGLVYRLTQYLNASINSSESKYNELQTTMQRLLETENKLASHMIVLEEHLSNPKSK